MNKLHTKEVDTLFEAILSLNSVEECYKFFEDACTIKEVLEIEDREINMGDKFREYEEWSSLAYLSVIAMLDEEYDCQIEEADFRKLQTIQDLYNATIKK